MEHGSVTKEIGRRLTFTVRVSTYDCTILIFEKRTFNRCIHNMTILHFVIQFIAGPVTMEWQIEPVRSRWASRLGGNLKKFFAERSFCLSATQAQAIVDFAAVVWARHAALPPPAAKETTQAIDCLDSNQLQKQYFHSLSNGEPVRSCNMTRQKESCCHQSSLLASP